MRLIESIIVHCSDSDNPDHNNINMIDSWHRQRGFSGVGYHYFITKNGTIQYGRELDKLGAHCKGHNSTSVGVCLSGKEHFTLAQYTKLRELIEALQMVLGRLDVYPHNYFNSNKTCPNFDLSEIGY